MKKLNKAPLIAAISTAIATSFAAGAVHADANPFAISEMAQGYMQVAGIVPAEGAAPAKAKTAEMSCGASMNKAADETKKTEGSCGEAKCGAMMKDGKMKEGMEKTCGAMMKGKEGACGAMGDDKGAAAEAPKAAPADAKAGEAACGAAMKGGEAACGAMMKDGAEGMKAKDMEAACGAKMAPAK
ncbi:MAG: hypothetical protein QX197_04710 [Methylococcaceae bacterium]